MINTNGKIIKKVEDEIFIYPTDTVWGLGCSIYSEVGYHKIAAIKKNNLNKPLSIMFDGIDEVMKYFQLPENLTLEWLNDFFKLETTLGLPLKSARIKIPKWATGDSSFVNLRCLETDVVKKIYKKINVPFFSTSLNITGMPPITDYFSALKFQKEHAQDCQFVTTDNSINQHLSGSSSTIVFLNEDFKFEIKREGKRSEEVQNQLRKLFSN